MPIRNAYEDIISFESLRQAEHDVSLGKSDRTQVLRYEWNLEEHLLDNHERLARMDFPEAEYRSFMVYEPKPRRIIYTDYNSKIIERALYNYLNPRLYQRHILLHQGPRSACRDAPALRLDADARQIRRAVVLPEA